MARFPFFLEVDGKTPLVVGGGTVALDKILKIIEFGLKVKVVAPEVLEEIRAIRGLEVQLRKFEDSDLNDEPFLVVAASNDSRANARVAALCRERKILHNVADEPDEDSFFFPAILKKGRFVAAATTGGASPFAASELKEMFAKSLPENLDAILDSLFFARERVKSLVEDERLRKEINRRAWGESLRLKRPLAAEEIESLVREVAAVDSRKLARDLSAAARPGDAPTLGRRGTVALVGAGAGDYTMITLRGAEVLRRADVVIYDELIDKRLLELASARAEKIPVGKRNGDGGERQRAINALMVERAQNGSNVARLKGGDPFLFGRGGEEALALLDAGIEFEVVPGVTSALAIPMEAGIPVTLRGASRGVKVVSGRAVESRPPCFWDSLAREADSIVIMMGLSSLETIADRLIMSGKDPQTPAAVIAGGATENRYDIRGTLGEIARRAKEKGATPPAVIVIGRVANLRLRSKGGLEDSRSRFAEGIVQPEASDDVFAKKARAR